MPFVTLVWILNFEVCTFHCLTRGFAENRVKHVCLLGVMHESDYNQVLSALVAFSGTTAWYLLTTFMQVASLVSGEYLFPHRYCQSFTLALSPRVHPSSAHNACKHHVPHKHPRRVASWLTSPSASPQRSFEAKNVYRLRLMAIVVLISVSGSGIMGKDQGCAVSKQARWHIKVRKNSSCQGNSNSSSVSLIGFWVPIWCSSISTGIVLPTITLLFRPAARSSLLQPAIT